MARLVCASSLAWLGLGGADLQVALSRTGAAATAGESAVEVPRRTPLAGPIVLPLQRVAASLGDEDEASFYVGEVSVGYPAQVFRVVFDTASGNTILPHRSCHNATCLEHRTYSPRQSLTAMDVEEDGKLVQQGQRFVTSTCLRDAATVSFSQADLGEGEVHAVFVRDDLCVGGVDAGEAGTAGRACADVAMLAALQMDEQPFRRLPSDGVVGLGLLGLTFSPMNSFFGQLLQGATGALPHFGLAFGEDKGELFLGGHDQSRLAAPLRWFPVDHPEVGLWQVAVQAVRVGNLTVDSCHDGCHGVLDSGTSRLGVQRGRLPALQAALAAGLRRDREAGCQGPELTFELGGFSLTLQAKDYAGGQCAPLLGPLDLPEAEYVGVYTFGAAVLRRYYAAFDVEQRKVGFAPLAAEGATASTGTLPVSPGGILLV